MSAFLLAALGFAVCAVAGTLVRAVLTSGQAQGQLPWRTLAVNVVGALALGFVAATPWWHQPTALTVAGLGSLTTFSTVVAECTSLFEDGRRGTAIAYLGLTLVVGIAAAWLGIEIGARV